MIPLKLLTENKIIFWFLLFINNIFGDVMKSIEYLYIVMNSEDSLN